MEQEKQLRLGKRLTRRGNNENAGVGMGTDRPKSIGPGWMQSSPGKTARREMEGRRTQDRSVSPSLSQPPALASAQASAQSISVHTIQSLRRIKQPNDPELRVCGAFLALLCEVEPRIETLSGRKVPVSSCWDTLLGYIQNPGHVVWMVRRLPYMLFLGKITLGNLYLVTCKRVQGILNGIQVSDLPTHQETSGLNAILTYVYACLNILLPPVPEPVPVPRSSKSPLLRKPGSEAPKQETKPESILTGLFSPLWLHSGLNSHSTIPDFQTVRDLHWRLDDAFKLYLREKLMLQSDLQLFIQTNKSKLLTEFADAAIEATKDMPESLRLYGIKPFLEKLHRSSVMEDIVKTVSSLVP